MAKNLLLLGAPFLLAACVTAPQKQSQWNVKTSTESGQKIWVTKADGSRQCDPKGKGLSPERAANELKGAGIIVFQSVAGNDGKMRAQKCGMPTGATVDVEISRIDLTKALSLGFVTKTSSSQ